MGQLYKVKTSDGELTINLNLSITLNQGESVNVSPIVSKDFKPNVKVPEIEEDTKFIIPDFSSTNILNDFGAN